MAARKTAIAKDWFSTANQLSPITRTANLLEQRVTSVADLPVILSPKEVAAILKMNPKTVSALMKSKKINSRKILGRRVSTPEWVADFMRKEFAKNG